MVLDAASRELDIVLSTLFDPDMTPHARKELAAMRTLLGLGSKTVGYHDATILISLLPIAHLFFANSRACPAGPGTRSDQLVINLFAVGESGTGKVRVQRAGFAY
jgi:hypothetical protein